MRKKKNFEMVEISQDAERWNFLVDSNRSKVTVMRGIFMLKGEMEVYLMYSEFHEPFFAALIFLDYDR